MLLLSLALVAVGCKDDGVRHYRVAKGEAAPHSHTHDAMPEGHPATGEAPGGMKGDVAPPPRPTGPGTLQWTLPKGWTEIAGEGGMRYATLKAPEADGVDISVTVLSSRGGGELANVNRWRGQISLAPIDEAAMAKARRSVTSKAGKVSVYDFTGEGANQDRLVAGLLEAPDGNTWFLKMKGKPASVAKALSNFNRFLESLRLG
jgi:hypothetical protein